MRLNHDDWEQFDSHVGIKSLISLVNQAHEDNQTLGRTMLAGNDLINQLEAEIAGRGPEDDRVMSARVKWNEMLPKGQEAFR